MDNNSENNSRRLNARQMRFLEAYKKSMCNLSLAATMAGIPRRTVYNWLNTDADFKVKYDGAMQEVHDFVESQLLKQISRGNNKAIKFYLLTKCKHRGYSY